MGSSHMNPRKSGQGKEKEKSNKIIDQVLNHMLGKEATRSFYHHLETTHSIQRHKIAQELDLFNRALKEYLGPGATTIEHAIHKNLRLGFEETEIDFPDRARILKLA